MAAMTAKIDTESWGPRDFPMTREAWDALEADAAKLGAQTAANDGYVTGRLDGETDAPTFIPNVVGQQLLRQLNNVRQVLERAVVVDDPDVAIIGRRITLAEDDGATSTYALVIPGEGDPRNGWVSVDSPVGVALLGRRIGDAETIEAPAGSGSATISSIEKLNRRECAPGAGAPRGRRLTPATLPPPRRAGSRARAPSRCSADRRRRRRAWPAGGG
jgi:hypothetical protein